MRSERSAGSWRVLAVLLAVVLGAACRPNPGGRSGTEVRRIWLEYRSGDSIFPIPKLRVPHGSSLARLLNDDLELALPFAGTTLRLRVIDAASTAPRAVIDLDCDGRLDDERALPGEAYRAREFGQVWANFELPNAAAVPERYGVLVSFGSDSFASRSGQLFALGAWWGRLPLGEGEALRVALHDSNADGSYVDEGLAVDADGDGLFTPPEHLQIGDTVRMGSRFLSVRALDPGGRYADIVWSDRRREDADRDLLGQLAVAPLVGMPLPNLRFTADDGTEFETDDLRGEVVLVGFRFSDYWTSDLDKVERRFEGSGLRVIRVEMPGIDAYGTKARETCEPCKHVWVDDSEATFLVGRDGRIVSRSLRFTWPEQAEKAVRLIEATLAGEDAGPASARSGVEAASDPPPRTRRTAPALPRIVIHRGPETLAEIPESMRDGVGPVPFAGMEAFLASLEEEMREYPVALLTSLVERVIVVGDMPRRVRWGHDPPCGVAGSDWIVVSARRSCRRHVRGILHHEVAHEALSRPAGVGWWANSWSDEESRAWWHPAGPAARDADWRRQRGFVSAHATKNLGEDFAEVSERLFLSAENAASDSGFWCQAASSSRLARKVRLAAEYWSSLDTALDKRYFASRAADTALAEAVLGLRPWADLTPSDASPPAATDETGASRSKTGLRPRDEARMVLVPGGRFRIGRTPQELQRGLEGVLAATLPDAERAAWAHEAAALAAGGPDSATRTVELPAFLIDEHEVTWEQFEAFADQTGRRGGWMRALDPADFPARRVTWIEADAYCRWSGGRLPTESEWEVAAGGPTGTTFPWGEGEPTVERVRHPWTTRAGQDLSEPTAVGQRPDGASPHGVLDLAGNVAEWTECRPEGAEAADDALTLVGLSCPVRGGSFKQDTVLGIVPTWSQRRDTCVRDAGIGFRCARDVP